MGSQRPKIIVLILWLLILNNLSDIVYAYSVSAEKQSQFVDVTKAVSQFLVDATYNLANWLFANNYYIIAVLMPYV